MLTVKRTQPKRRRKTPPLICADGARAVFDLTYGLALLPRAFELGMRQNRRTESLPLFHQVADRIVCSTNSNAFDKVLHKNKREVTLDRINSWASALQFQLSRLSSQNPDDVFERIDQIHPEFQLLARKTFLSNHDRELFSWAREKYDEAYQALPGVSAGKTCVEQLKDIQLYLLEIYLASAHLGQLCGELIFDFLAFRNDSIRERRCYLLTEIGIALASGPKELTEAFKEQEGTIGGIFGENVAFSWALGLVALIRSRLETSGPGLASPRLIWEARRPSWNGIEFAGPEREMNIIRLFCKKIRIHRDLMIREVYGYQIPTNRDLASLDEDSAAEALRVTKKYKAGISTLVSLVRSSCDKQWNGWGTKYLGKQDNEGYFTLHLPPAQIFGEIPEAPRGPRVREERREVDREGNLASLKSKEDDQ